MQNSESIFDVLHHSYKNKLKSSKTKVELQEAYQISAQDKRLFSTAQPLFFQQFCRRYTI